MTYLIRKATAADAAGLERCMARAYATYSGRITDLPDVTAGLVEDIASGRIWVAQASDAPDGDPAGGLVLILGTREAKLANVAVDPDSRGVGLGRRLIETAEKICRELDIPRLTLTTHAQMPENVSLYTRMGWQVTGQSGNKVHMLKTIGAGGNTG